PSSTSTQDVSTQDTAIPGILLTSTSTPSRLSGSSSPKVDSPTSTSTRGAPTASLAPHGSRAAPPWKDRNSPPAQRAAYRPIDEVGNNVANPTLGAAGTDLLRISPAAYADGISAPSLASNPGARVISDILNNQANPADPSQDLNTVDANSLSDF